MHDLFKRLYGIARSNVPHPWGKVDRFLADWEARLNLDGREDQRDTGKAGDTGGHRFDDASKKADALNYADYPPQVVQDLADFNLTPPSSLEAVRKARNREIKKYHSDRFVNDPGKYENSKKIMQHYNAAYERLKAFFEGKET